MEAIQEHLIDCTKYPDSKVYTHDTVLGRQFCFSNSILVQPHDNRSNKAKYIWDQIRWKKPLNVCVLDYLLEHQDMIPDIWKNMHIFFFGTIFIDCFENLDVLYLFWDEHNRSWFKSSRWLEDGFGLNDYVIIAKASR